MRYEIQINRLSTHRADSDKLQRKSVSDCMDRHIGQGFWKAFGLSFRLGGLRVQPRLSSGSRGSGNLAATSVILYSRGTGGDKGLSVRFQGFQGWRKQERREGMKGILRAPTAARC